MQSCGPVPVVGEGRLGKLISSRDDQRVAWKVEVQTGERQLQQGLGRRGRWQLLSGPGRVLLLPEIRDGEPMSGSEWGRFRYLLPEGSISMPGLGQPTAKAVPRDKSGAGADWGNQGLTGAAGSCPALPWGWGRTLVKTDHECLLPRGTTGMGVYPIDYLARSSGASVSQV